MDGVDYTKALSKQTQGYYDSLDKTREAAKKQVESAEELAATKLGRHKENAAEKQLKAEKIYQDRIETITDDAKKLVQEKQQKYAEKNKKESDAFVKSKEESISDYQKRLDNLSEAYRHRDKETSEFHDSHLNNNKGRFKEKVADLQRKHEKELDGVIDRTREGTSRLKDDVTLEKQRIAKTGQEKIQNLEHKQSLESSREKNDMRRDIKQIHQTSDDLVTHNEKRANENFARIQSEKKINDHEMQQLFSEQSDKQHMAHANEKEKIVQNQKEYVGQLQKDFNKQRAAAMVESKRNAGEDTTGRYAKEQEMTRNKDMMTSKQKQYSDLLTNAQKKYKDEIDTLKSRNDLNARDTAIINAKNIDDKEKFNGMMSTEMTGNFNRQKEVIIGSYQDRENINNENSDRILSNEKDVSKKRYDNLRSTFTETVNNLAEKNRAVFEEVRQTEGQRRTKLVEKNRADTNLAITELKKVNADKINTSSIEYEKRLADAAQKTRAMQQFYEDKLAASRQELINTLDKQSYIFNEQRKEDTGAMKNQMAIREEELNGTIDSWRSRYNKDMTDMSQAYERKMKTMMLDYENRINTMLTDRDKENNRLVSGFNQQIEKNKLANKNEKDRLIGQYENQLAKLKEAFEAKSQSIDDYKAEVARTQRKEQSTPIKSANKTS